MIVDTKDWEWKKKSVEGWNDIVKLIPCNIKIEDKKKTGVVRCRSPGGGLTRKYQVQDTIILLQ